MKLKVNWKKLFGVDDKEIIEVEGKTMLSDDANRRILFLISIVVAILLVPIDMALYYVSLLEEPSLTLLETKKTFGSFWNWGLFALWLQLAYVALSIRQIGPKDLGVVVFFGRPLFNAHSGLVWVPRWICQLEKTSKLVQEREYPDPKNTFYLPEGGREVPEGKVPPIRVIQGSENVDIEQCDIETFLKGVKFKSDAVENDEEKKDLTEFFVGAIEAVKKGITKGNKDPLHGRLTTEISVIVRYRISDFRVFIGVIGSMESLDLQVEDMLVAELRMWLAKLTPAETLAVWSALERILEAKTKNLIESWGVEVRTVRLKEVDVKRTVNEAIQRVVAEGFHKNATITLAEAERKKRTEEGKGLAEAEKVLLQAKAMGYKKIAKELGIKEGELIMFAEAVKEMAEKANYTLVAGGGGLADLFTTVQAIQDTMNRIKPTGVKSPK